MNGIEHRKGTIVVLAVSHYSPLQSVSHPSSPSSGSLLAAPGVHNLCTDHINLNDHVIFQIQLGANVEPVTERHRFSD